MKADNIKSIVGTIDKLPYNAILFDGEWGIGKTYAVNETLKGNVNVCRISMFGVSDIKEIYHEALFQLVFKNSISGKIGEIADNITENLSKVSKTIGQIREVAQSFARERELFLLLSKGFKKLHIIVVDDLERISNNLNLEEVFGVIEELKQCYYIKVIVIANVNRIEQREIFDKYKEKVIDREYHITECAEEVKWSELNIHAGFIAEFLNYHQVKNLRTLQKAQNFFDDVKLFCNDIQNEEFMAEVRLVCFAVVVESIENLYYSESEENNDYFSILNKKLEYRILKYLHGIKSSKSLVTMLTEYYYNERSISSEEMKIEYSLYLRAGEKPNFYRSDKEIEYILPNLEQSMEKAETLGELNKFADEYAIWSDILQKENGEVLEEYRVLVQKILKEMILEGKEEILSYEHDLFHISSKKVQKIYSEERECMKEFLVNTYISALTNNTQGKRAFDYSYNLRKYFENAYFKEMVEKKLTPLYNKNSFPIDSMSEEKYHTCYNIMYVLYHADKDTFLQYCDELKQSCDKMAVHRIMVITQEIKR